MKEKKTEEIIEEAIDIEDPIINYLEKERIRIHQYMYFIKASKICCGYCVKSCEDVLDLIGIDVSKPVTIKTGYNKENIGDAFSEFISDWINAYNDLDLTKVDNYTRTIIDSFIPLPTEIVNIKKAFKKCEQQSMEE